MFNRINRINHIVINKITPPEIVIFPKRRDAVSLS